MDLGMSHKAGVGTARHGVVIDVPLPPGLFIFVALILIIPKGYQNLFIIMMRKYNYLYQLTQLGATIAQVMTQTVIYLHQITARSSLLLRIPHLIL